MPLFVKGLAFGFVLAATVGPGWAPGEAHLTGKRGEEEEAATDGPQAPGSLDALEKEIGGKRKA